MFREAKKSLPSNSNKYLTFQQVVSVPDGEGGHDVSSVIFFYCFGSLESIRAVQQFRFKSVNVDATHYVKIRAASGLKIKTKWQGSSWSISWSGIAGETVKIHYKIGSAAWVQISASETNDGSYTWTIPTGAIGENVVVRVAHQTDASSYVDTDKYDVVNASITNRQLNETDTIKFGSRIFEILTIENLQERDAEKLILCKERR